MLELFLTLIHRNGNGIIDMLWTDGIEILERNLSSTHTKTCDASKRHMLYAHLNLNFGFGAILPTTIAPFPDFLI